MAANFKFVPRSVKHKPQKTKELLRKKQNSCNTLNITEGSFSPVPATNQDETTSKDCVNVSQFSGLSETCSAVSNGQKSCAKTIKSSSSMEQGHVVSTYEISRHDYDEETSNDYIAEKDIVCYSKNQRWPCQDEPVCVVCGKYGEYICDQTEADVCSKECKAKNLQMRKLAEKQTKILPPGPGVALVNENKAETVENSFQTSSVAMPQVGYLQKYTYSAHPQIASLTEAKVNELRNHLEISVRGDNIARPILEFAQCGLNKRFLENLEKCGYVTPTPVQMQVIPVALSSRDLLACAQTGSGKTAAFLVPMITRIHHNLGSTSSVHPKGLVLAPTRELCMQIEDQAKELMSGLPNMKSALIIGGIPMPNQIYRLQQGAQLVFATPGRLAEILSKTDVVDFSHVEMLVIDEVDVLMQMGFESQVQSILEKLPTIRQTLLFSATIPPAVERISSTLLSNPLWISVGVPSAPNMDVKQVIVWVEDKSKKKRLFALLKDRKYFTPPILVFVDSRLGADMLSEAIIQTCDVRCASLHGDKVQNERSRILKAFLAEDYDVLVCTGVLGRGLDLRTVRQVINFDMPSSVDEYIHQIGRAGRLGSTGLAITFINNTNKTVFLDLMETVQARGVKLPDELVNSPHLLSQQQERERKRKKKKRKLDESYLNRENLMEILKKSAFRRRLRDR